MKVLLTENKYKLVPQGEVKLTITKAEAKPSGAPQIIEITFKHENGATMISKYDLTKEIGNMIFSILIRNTMGNVDEFDTNDLPELVGKAIMANVEHKEVPSKKDPTITNIFPSIKRIIGSATSTEAVSTFSDEDDDL